MSFMQKSLFFWEGVISNLLILAVCLCLINYDDTCFRLFIVPVVFLFMILIFQLIWKKPVVTIDELGITCQRGTQILWSYRWYEIAELRIGNQLRNPCVEIIIKSDCHSDGKLFNGAWFQLSFQAKRALKQYCPYPKVV